MMDLHTLPGGHDLAISSSIYLALTTGASSISNAAAATKRAT
jgi:hypothetical protein